MFLLDRSLSYCPTWSQTMWRRPPGGISESHQVWVFWVEPHHVIISLPTFQSACQLSQQHLLMAIKEQCLHGTPAPPVEHPSSHLWWGTPNRKLGAMLWRSTGSGDISTIRRRRHITRRGYREPCLSSQRAAWMKLFRHQKMGLAFQVCNRTGIWTWSAMQRNILAFPLSCRVVWVMRYRARSLTRSKRVLFTWRASIKNFCITVRIMIDDLMYYLR